MAANQQDFLGEGTNQLDQLGLPMDPNAGYAGQQARVRRDAQNTSVLNAPYNQQRAAADAAQLRQNTAIGQTGAGRAGIDLPFVRDIPGVGKVIESGFEAAQGAPLNFAQNVANNPGLAVATLGVAPAIGTADYIGDRLATGVARQITGDDQANVNLPLTPAQLYDPNGPIYTDRTGSVNAPGLRDAGNAISNAVSGGLGGLGGGGGGGGGSADGRASLAPTLNQQLNVPRATAFEQGQQAQGINQQAQARAQGFQQQAAGFNPQAQQVAGQFGVGQQIQAQNQGGIQQINPNSLGGVSNVASQLGAAPGNIAGRLGGAPTIGNVGNIAGLLGAAPQVGDVGNIQMGAGPGNIAGLLSTQGQTNQDQGAMMQRLNGFLDQAPGPSIAEAQLQQAQSDNMAQLIGAARSGRGGAGSQAQALRGAMSEGGAIASDTAGQMATLRAQEEDMLRNRQLAGIGLGGQLATSMRGQDIQYRGQDLGALMSDQATQLGTRGQDLQGAMANQGTQTALEQLRANTALGARGQNLGALQSDQSTQAQLAAARGQLALGARGQDLGALQSDQSTALGARGQNLGALSADAANQLGMRGQNLGALQSNQATALGARGQNVQQELGLAGVNATLRGQDANVLMSDADRALNAQDLGLRGQLGFGNLANTATGQGLDFLGQSNQQALGYEGLAQDAINNANRNATALQVAQIADPSLLESLGGPFINTLGRILFPGGN